MNHGTERSKHQPRTLARTVAWDRRALSYDPAVFKCPPSLRGNGREGQGVGEGAKGVQTKFKFVLQAKRPHENFRVESGVREVAEGAALRPSLAPGPSPIPAVFKDAFYFVLVPLSPEGPGEGPDCHCPKETWGFEPIPAQIRGVI